MIYGAKIDTVTIRTSKEFAAYIAFLCLDEGYTLTEVASNFGINHGYLSRILHDPDYKIPTSIKKACNIRDRNTKRVIVYAGSDMVVKAMQIEKLTDGEYTIIRRRDD